MAPSRSGLPAVSGWLRRRVLLTAIPFALLANSSSVLLTLRIEPDGSALRQISVRAAPYFRSQLPRWVDDVRADGPWDATWGQTTESDYLYSRDARLPGLAGQGEEAALTIEDVCQQPLSLYTTYHWHEVVSFSYLYASDPQTAQAGGKQLQYEVVMPGTVGSATVSPMQGSNAKTEGDTATFELDASQGQQTIEVESYSLRWGYLLVLAYLAGYVAYCVGRVLAYQVRIRPRKI